MIGHGGCDDDAQGDAVEAQRFVDCRVLRRDSLTEDLHHLVVEPSSESTLDAEPGQFAMIKANRAGLHPLLARPMSILRAGRRLEFLVRRCGQGTALITEMSAGDGLTVLGPFGNSWFPRAARQSGALVMVAGGVGLAPLLFAAERLVSQGASQPLFLYGAREASELVMLDRIEACAALETATDDGSAGAKGFVTDLLEQHLRAGEVSEVWSCGPEPMMARVAQLCAMNDVSCRVSIEARMACGRGLCLGCARLDLEGEPVYVCRDGPIFDAATLYPPLG